MGELRSRLPCNVGAMNTKSLAIVFSMLLAVVASISCSRARNDVDITADVQARVHADSALTTSPVTVQANNGVVVLSGTVATDAARSAAETAAKQVEGVKGVINNLQLVTAAAAEIVEKQIHNSEECGRRSPVSFGEECRTFRRQFGNRIGLDQDCRRR